MTAFISYKSQDATIANRVRKAILAKGGPQSVWMAPWDIPFGQDYTQCIPEAMMACDRVILILSRAANQSDYVRKEIDRAIKYGKPIIPVLIENFEPRGGLEFLIAGCQRIPAIEQDSAAWMGDVVEAALSPTTAPAQPRSRKAGEFIQVDATKIAFAAGALATIVSFMIHGVPVQAVESSGWLLAARDIAPSPYLMLGLLAVMAAGVWAARKINAQGMRSFVVRSSDLVAMMGLLFGGALFGVFFLLTPLVAVTLVVLLYLPLRSHFLRRWGILAVIVVGLVGLSAWWIEGGLYRLAFYKGPVVAVVPVCQGGECEWDQGSSSYQTFVEGLTKVLTGDNGVMMPSKDSAVRFYESRKAFEQHSRYANLIALINHGRTFDRLVEVSLQPGCETSAGVRTYHLTANAYSLQERSAPFWSDWKIGRQLEFGNMTEFEGGALRDASMASLLLGGLIIEHVLGFDGEATKLPFSQQEQLAILRGFLKRANQPSLSAQLSEPARQAVKAGQSSNALEQARASFTTALAELRKASEPVAGDPGSSCDKPSDDALVQLKIRNNVDPASEDPAPEPVPAVVVGP